MLVALVVGCTVMGDLLQSLEMKRHGEIHDFHPRGWPRLLATLAQKKFLILGIFFMAISFFAFMTLLETADLSFAVPVSAATLVLETILARLRFERAGRFAALAGSLPGGLRRGAAGQMILLIAVAAIAGGVSAVRDSRVRCSRRSQKPGVRSRESGAAVSILKPVRGAGRGISRGDRFARRLETAMSSNCCAASAAWTIPPSRLSANFPSVRVVECHDADAQREGRRADGSGCRGTLLRSSS